MGMVAIGLGIFMLVYTIYLAFYPFKPVQLNHSPLKVLTPVVKAGENVRFEMNFTKLMNVKPYVTYFLVDGSVVKLNESGTNRPLGTQIIESEKEIPLSTRPNTYHIQIDLVYPINMFQTKYYSWRSEDFKVVNGN